MAGVFSPLSPSVLDDPSSAYRFLHTEAPVHLVEDFAPPFYTLSRYKDVEAALQDIGTFSSEFGQGPRFSQPAGLLSDPPQHTFFRGLVQKAFTPRAIDGWTGRISTLAADLVEARPRPQSWDLHDDFAFPLPVTVIAEMLGVPGEDLHLFKRWSDASVAAMGAVDPQPYQADLGDMAQYLAGEIAARRADPSRDDLIAALVRASDGGRTLSDGEILGVVVQLLVGGNKTTTSLITNMVWRIPGLSTGRWRRACASTPRCWACSVRPRGAWNCTARSSRRRRKCSSTTQPRTGIQRCSTHRIPFRWTVHRSGISRSAWGCTSASVRRWPGSKHGRRCSRS